MELMTIVLYFNKEQFFFLDSPVGDTAFQYYVGYSIERHRYNTVLQTEEIKEISCIFPNKGKIQPRDMQKMHAY